MNISYVQLSEILLGITIVLSHAFKKKKYFPSVFDG